MPCQPSPYPPSISRLAAEDSNLSGLCLTWNQIALQQFIAHANKDTYTSIKLPVWVSEAPRELTPAGFMQDTMAYLNELTSADKGCRGTTLSVTSIDQATKISARMGDIEADPFMQAFTEKLDYDVALVVVRLMVDIAAPEMEVLNFAPPPSHLLF